MDKIRSIYEELVKYNPFSFNLRMVNFQNILSSINNGQKDFCVNEKQPSKSEEYLDGARKIRSISVDKGEIIGATKDYVYGYQDLSFDEFLSYIYWRTQIRKRKSVIVPGGFLALYLIEIVNFIEFDKVQDCLEMMGFLESLSLDEKSNMRQIKKAKEELVFHYGVLEQAEKIVDYLKYEYLLEDEKILHKNHTSLLKCFCQRHYSSFLKSKMYLQYANKLENDFNDWFYSVCNYFFVRKINFLDLYNGDEKYFKMSTVYIKEIVQEKIIAKEIYLNNKVIIRVSDEVELLTKFFTDGTLKNKEHMYIRSVVIKYILRLYECKKRKELKFPKTYPSITELHKGSCNLEIAKCIETIFESEEFNQYFT